jgi:hypothetical protein
VGLQIEYCGEEYIPDSSKDFEIGREGDLVIDDNPVLHPKLLRLYFSADLWWIQNVGARLAAMLGTPDGSLNAWLGPQARMPMTVPELKVRFVAGPTTYELSFSLDPLPAGVAAGERAVDSEPTPDGLKFSFEQRLLLLALLEPVLCDRLKGVSSSLSSPELAQRLGWSLTKFNRKLDAICEKFEAAGVRGLHGSPDRLAFNRKARLIEYLLMTQYFTPADLKELRVYVAAQTAEYAIPVRS